MKIVLFYHSLISDWNHGNAHFLRGIVAELQDRGHDVRIYEPAGGWSLRNLLKERGRGAVEDFHAALPHLSSEAYELEALDLDDGLSDAELVLVHEWNEPQLVARIGAHRRARGSYGLLFHDTHHRAVGDPSWMAALDLSGYDGVLAFGRVVRDAYLARGCVHAAWVWHEAADVRVFGPAAGVQPQRDLVWIGNWGDEERSSELQEFLLEPAQSLQLSGTIHGVRYPAAARARIAQTGLDYAGWVPNYRVPQLFASHRMTVHIPRRPYVRKLPGIPTIRVFEALACGIPLICSPWSDGEGLFTAGRDYLVAEDGETMTTLMKQLLHDPDLRASIAQQGRETILGRHTCAHRVDELLAICEEIA